MPIINDLGAQEVGTSTLKSGCLSTGCTSTHFHIGGLLNKETSHRTPQYFIVQWNHQGLQLY